VLLERLPALLRRSLIEYQPPLLVGRHGRLKSRTIIVTTKMTPNVGSEER
jgi:hypothetical protein